MKSRLLGAALASGGKRRGNRLAPYALHPLRPNFIVHERSSLLLPWPEVADTALASARSLAARSALWRRGGVRPLLVGGDHSEAIGFWTGIASVRSHPMGMIWIDAHMDSHTPDTSLSHRLHGMPLAILLGQGDTRWHSICPVPMLDTQYCTLIGFRSFEAPEIKLLERLGMALISIHELRRRGWPTLWRQALRRARCCPGGYGISLDLDALSPHLAPGVSVPEPRGIDMRQLQRQLKFCRQDRQLLALEIAEFNPRMDIRGRTAKLVRQLLHDQGITNRLAYPRDVG